MRHVLSLSEIGPTNLSQIIDHSLAISSGLRGRPLEGKVVGIYFKVPSTRTRTAFGVAAIRLGAGTITYGPMDLQLVTGETMLDTARVLSEFLDILVIRTNGPLSEMRALASQNQMSIINAMSDNEHPTQAIGDLVTIKEVFGRLDDIHILYVGEGNNSAAALALSVGMTPGMRLTLLTPEGYDLPRDVIDRANSFAGKNGEPIRQSTRITDLPSAVDVVYTTRWRTMGAPKTDPHWREKFEPYRITKGLMARASKSTGTIFLHDLPAVRGEDVVDEVIDGPQSRAFLQARHKLTSAMAVLSWCVNGD